MPTEDLDDIKEKARVVAEATGRDEADVLADLLDDGILNDSHRQTEEPKDLITQLKEAAALITTVQAVNAQVSENKVLNGGENKTEVVVETTLEGDIVDRALASAQRKADDLKKLIATLVPVFLLLTGGSLEAFGVIDVLGSNEGDVDDGDIYIEYGGCTAPGADNYDPEADYDDGSCYWDDTPSGPGPPCNEDWRWDAVTIQDFDANGEGFNNDLQIQMTFNDWNKCNRHMEGYFVVEIWDEDRGFMWDSYQIDNKFRDQYTIDDHHYDMDSGQYVINVEYHFDGSHWGGPSQLVYIEAPDPQPVYGCTDSEATNYDDKATEDDETCEYPEPEPECDAFIDNLQTSSEADTVDVIFSIGQNEDSSCENYDIEITLLPVDDNEGEEIIHEQSISGSSNYYSHTFNEVSAGDWQAQVVLSSEGEEMQVDLSGWLYITDSEPEICDINLYGIQFANNDTHASVGYDLDCGYGDESGGHNVSVQFSVVENGTYDPLLDYAVSQHYISGYVEDVHYQTLGDFTVEDATHYDFYWIAIWGDLNDQSIIERSWKNVAFDHPEDEPEPQPCENLTITSESLVLTSYGSDISITWNLTHDGPIAEDCYVDIEIFITVYQNGAYYNVSEYHQNPTFRVFNNHDGNQTMFMGSAEIALFNDLPPGTYEILAKYRIEGTSDQSEDHFANSVSIS